jgi:hypothetical protein
MALASAGRIATLIAGNHDFQRLDDSGELAESTWSSKLNSVPFIGMGLHGFILAATCFECLQIPRMRRVMRSKVVRWEGNSASTAARRCGSLKLAHNLPMWWDVSMSDAPDRPARPPDWGPELDFWVPDDGSDPDIPWPANFEVCGVPAYDPWPLDREPKRHGRTYMAWPMYNIDDPVRGIEAFCRVLEQMSPAALEHWYSLPDRVLSISAGDREMDFSDLDATGFLLPPALIRRVRHLRLRIQVTLCPKAAVRLLSRY